MNVQYHSRARGIALPVMLIILAVMLIGSLYLMKASTTSTLTSANLAYDSSLSKAADLGLHAGANWLKATALANRSKLLQDSGTDGYVATMVAGTPVSSPAFWAGSVTITDTATPANTIEYVIHRLCSLPGAYDAPGAPPNSCVQTTAAMTAGAPVAVGESLSDFEQMPDPPQIHYVVTARIFGPRGGNVVNQAIVLIGV